MLYSLLVEDHSIGKSMWAIYSFDHFHYTAVDLRVSSEETEGVHLLLPVHQTSQRVRWAAWRVPERYTEMPSWWNPQCLQTGCCQEREKAKEIDYDLTWRTQLVVTADLDTLNTPSFQLHRTAYSSSRWHKIPTDRSSAEELANGAQMWSKQQVS